MALADIVRIVHLILVIFIVIAPFVYPMNLLITYLHIMLCIALLMHWMANSDRCILTSIEKKLRGVDDNKSFLHNILSPMFSLNSSDYNVLSYFVVICTLILSIRNLIIILQSFPFFFR